MNSRSYLNLVYEVLNNKKSAIHDIYKYGFQQYLDNEAKINALTTTLSEKLIDKFISKSRLKQDTILKGLPVLIKDTFLVFVT